jgi:hypothetical protein
LILKWFLLLKIQIIFKKPCFVERKVSWGCDNTWANGTGHTNYQLRVRATLGYATPATRGTSPGPSQRLPWPVFSKNMKQGALRVWNI